MNNCKFIFHSILICMVCFLCSCETLNVNSIGTEKQFTKEDDEARIWQRCKEEEDIIYESGTIYNNARLNEYLNGLVKKIIPQEVSDSGVSVEVFVLRSPIINAGVYPNGVMYINMGLLADLDNEAELVYVLGHELTHFIGRHTLKQFRNLKNKSAFFATLSIATASASGAVGAPVDLSSLSVFTFISSISSYSRDMERRADEGGFNILLNNNYAPQESVKAIEIFETDLKGDKVKTKIPYVFMDHPTNQKRLKVLKQLCSENESALEDGNRITGAREYQMMVKGLLLDTAGLDIKVGRFHAAQRLTNKYLLSSPQDARAYYYLGEVFSNRKDKGDEALAIANYKKAIELDESFPLAHRELGLIYYKNNSYKEAFKEFNRYLSILPDAEDKKYIDIYLEKLKKEKCDEN
ncbi:MAG: M48 family metalloprotease [Candidatus Omnitrophota bacterium]